MPPGNLKEQQKNVSFSEKTPLISVVIPSFNREKKLVKAIESVLAQQSAEPMEIIVVDDCSTDGTEGAVRSFMDSRLKYIKHAENRGGAVARNTGIEAASGRYIAFLDSDDSWDPGKMTRQLAAIKCSPNPAMTVVYTQLRCCRPSSTEILPRRGKTKEESVSDYLFLNDGVIQTSAIFVGAELAKRTMFDPGLRKHQDYDFCMRLEQNGANFLFVDTPLLTWNHDLRRDRISNQHDTDLSEAFLAKKESSLNKASADAFWIKHILLRKLRVSPLSSLAKLSIILVRRDLSINWFWFWLRSGIRRRFLERNSTQG